MPDTKQSKSTSDDKNPSLHLLRAEYSQRNEREAAIDTEFRELNKEFLSILGDRAWNWDMQVLLKRQVLSRLLHYYEVYKLILPVPGVILEFGVQWGATLATLTSLRGMFEPYNHARKIVGFDTFEGFASVSDQDLDFSKSGQYTVEAGYEKKLDLILSMHEELAPISHIKKFELIKGDACETVPRYIQSNPHLIIACAIFDFDIYKPTKAAIDAVLPRLTKGSVLVFDELNCKHFPGETQALIECLGLNNLRLICNPHQPYTSYAIYEG
jgi:hypothetical protein